MHTLTCIHTCIHAYTLSCMIYSHAHTHAYMLVHIHAWYNHMHTHAHMLIHMHDIFTCTHTCIHAYTHSCMMHSHAYTHACIHTFMHAYIHTRKEYGRKCTKMPHRGRLRRRDGSILNLTSDSSAAFEFLPGAHITSEVPMTDFFLKPQTCNA